MNHSLICPTVTAYDKHEYRNQIETLEPFATQIHIDLMDGIFAPTKSPSLEDVWLPKNIVSDIHLMYQKPELYIDKLINLRPNMIIIHFEADLDHDAFSKTLHNAKIKVGLAILSDTPVENCYEYLKYYDQVLIFSGKLGYHGGQLDNDLIAKVGKVRTKFPNLQIAWDGGINDQNLNLLINSGVDVLNVGGYIQKSPNPQEAYAKLISIIGA